MERDVRMFIARRVRELRQARNISQGEMALRTGLGRTSITNMEKGNQGLVKPAFIHIAAALGMEMADLLPTWRGVGNAEAMNRTREIAEIETLLDALKPTEDRIRELHARWRELAEHD